MKLKHQILLHAVGQFFRFGLKKLLLFSLKDLPMTQQMLFYNQKGNFFCCYLLKCEHARVTVMDFVTVKHGGIIGMPSASGSDGPFIQLVFANIFGK